MSSKTVAYLVNQYPAVSHAFIRREIQALERRGWEVHRVAIRGWDLPLVDPQDQAERVRTEYLLLDAKAKALRAVAAVAWRTPARLLRAFGSVGYYARVSGRGWAIHVAYLLEACMLVQFMRRKGITHVHAHFATNPAEIASLAARLGDIEYSFTAHGSDIMDDPQGVGLVEKVGGAKFVATVCSFGRNQVFRWVPYSQWHRVKVVRCGLEPGYGSALAPLPDSINARATSVPMLLCIGRLSKEKGQRLLIDALALRAAQGAPMPQTVLVGDGPLRNELSQAVSRGGLTDVVRFAGWQTAGQIEDWLDKSAALIVPSLSEGLPVVIMEAMAHGRPVIAPYLAGIPELVVHGETGFLYPASSVEGLAAAIDQCLAMPKERAEVIAATARARVWSMHDVDISAAQLEAAISGRSDAPPN